MNANTGGCRRQRRSGGQLGKDQVGGSTTSRQTAAAANALEIDVPPSHQGNPRFGAVGGGHAADYAMDAENLPYRRKVVISVSETHWGLDCDVVGRGRIRTVRERMDRNRT
ncbi:MAG: hypothetical protein ABI253_13345 [Mycobacterium sp.]